MVFPGWSKFGIFENSIIRVVFVVYKRGMYIYFVSIYVDNHAVSSNFGLPNTYTI